MATEKPKRDFRREVTDKIIGLLKKGIAPWQKPWNAGKAQQLTRPVNGATSRPYSGGNVVNLMAENIQRGYDDPRWLTYEQAQREGWQVKRGSKGAHVEFWQFSKKEVIEGEVKEVKLENPIQRIFTVFNAQDIEGIPPLEPVIRQPHEVIESAERILQNSGAVIREGDAAYYTPGNDVIVLPPRETFNSTVGYYGTALHELGHWTGHKDRLNRDLGHAFGTEEYAREELRAELTSTFLQSDLGIPHDTERHAAYLESWIKVLQDDKNEIFRAAKDADRAADFVLGLSAERDIEHAAPAPAVEPVALEDEIRDQIRQWRVTNENDVMGRAAMVNDMRERAMNDPEYKNAFKKQNKDVFKILDPMLPIDQQEVIYAKAASGQFEHPEELERLNRMGAKEEAGWGVRSLIDEGQGDIKESIKRVREMAKMIPYYKESFVEQAPDLKDVFSSRTSMKRAIEIVELVRANMQQTPTAPSPSVEVKPAAPAPAIEPLSEENAKNTPPVIEIDVAALAAKIEKDRKEALREMGASAPPTLQKGEQQTPVKPTLNDMTVKPTGKEIERDQLVLPRRIAANYNEVGDGKFARKQDGRVVFEDKGERLATSESSTQTVEDMVAYAKAKNWSSLKLTGSQEFRREAWLQAESQGLKTAGYTPKEADFKALETLRQSRAVNAITPLSEPKPFNRSPELKATPAAPAPTLGAAPRTDRNQAVWAEHANERLTINEAALKNSGVQAPDKVLQGLAFWRGVIEAKTPPNLHSNAFAKFDFQAKSNPEALLSRLEGTKEADKGRESPAKARETVEQSM